MNKRAQFLSFITLLLVICFTVNAQSVTGRISGVVKDGSGAVVPGASVTVTNEATQIGRAAVTNEEGFYVATNLAPGVYVVSVEHAGFKKFLASGNVLVSDGRLTVDVTLDAGAVSETVTVTAEAGETVNTTSGELARVVDGQQVQNLALNGRNYLQLVTLVPGAPLLDFDAIAQTTSGSMTIASNGGRGDTNNLTIDGGYNISKANNSAPGNNVGVDFIQEVKIQTSNFSAENGRQSGAAINVTTRGGTNEFHGSAFEFLRNDKFDARNFFATNVRKLRFNDFGYSLGGPIIKNKLFFFGGQEWKYIRRTLDPARRTLPTFADLRGDLSFRLRGADGAAGTADDGFLRDPLRTGTCAAANRTACFPGNIIPADRITADGRALAKAYEAMNRAAQFYVDTPTANNVTYELSSPFDFRQDIMRVDYKLNQAHALSGRYLHDHTVALNVSQPPTLVTDRPRPGHASMISHTWTARPTLINEARYNLTVIPQDNIPVGAAWRRDTYGFTFRQLFEDGRYNAGIPEVALNGFASLTGPSGANAATAYDHTVTDTLTWVRGAHTVKSGMAWTRTMNNQLGVVTSTYTGAVSFNQTGNSLSTGNPIADMLLGNFRTYSEVSAPPLTPWRSTQVDAFVSDSWKAFSRLSLEYGARYTYMGALYSANDNLGSFNAQRYNPSRAVTVNRDGTLVADAGDRLNGIVKAGVDGPRGIFDSPNRIAPRFSFAYAPFGHNRTAIRGGFGTFYNIWRGDITQRGSENPPFSQQAQYENQNLSGLSRATLVPFGNLLTLDPLMKPSYTMSYSLSVQQEMPQGIFLEVAYVGSQGRHLLRRPDINQPSFEDLRANAALPAANRAATNFLRPFRGYSAIQQTGSDSNSNYNALQTHATKRKGQAVFTVSYTWSKTLTDASSFDEAIEDYRNRSYSYGSASFDRRHVFVSTYTYSVPRLQRLGRFADTVLSMWEASGITRFQSGNQFTVTGNTSIGNRRADYVGGEINLSGDARTVSRWFNTSAFTTAPESRLGTAGVRNVKGPGLQLWDLSLRKRFALTEQWKLQFQADFFNLFNQANFLNVATVTTNPDFGTVTSAAPGRNIQLALRLTF
ncbi:MAG: carboxypeptidase regulatory-like domain-containing protein [Blastocatellia bacterium]